MSDDDKEFGLALGRWRQTIIMGADLSGAALRVVLLMLERTNKAEFDDGGPLMTWMAEDNIAACLDLEPRTVRKARNALCAEGITFVWEKGGHGPGNTSTYAFDDEWLKSAEVLLEQRGSLAIWGDIRGTKRSPMGMVGKSPTPSARGTNRVEKGEQSRRKGGTTEQLRGTKRSPEADTKQIPKLETKQAHLKMTPAASLPDLDEEEKRTLPARPAETSHRTGRARSIGEVALRDGAPRQTSTSSAASSASRWSRSSRRRSGSSGSRRTSSSSTSCSAPTTTTASIISG